MIEEEELFTTADETGYRICISDQPSSSFGRIFSAHWDPTNADRMYLCAQNGFIKALQCETNESKTYEIQFRRFRTGNFKDVESSRLIKNHFDK